jgi:hypothetical protein
LRRRQIRDRLRRWLDKVFHRRWLIQVPLRDLWDKEFLRWWLIVYLRWLRNKKILRWGLIEVCLRWLLH